MSSISIVQEHDKFTYVVDTAQSCVIGGDEIYRIQGMVVKKVHKIGKDMVFMSGIEPVLGKIRNKMRGLLEDGHINVLYLQEHIRKEFPPINDINSKVINGFAIMSIIDRKTVIVAMTQSYNHFEIIKMDAPPKGQLKLSVDGFDNELYDNKIMENERDCFNRTGSYNILESILNAYRKNYSEGVGGTLLMYSFDNTGVTHIHSEELAEQGLKYVHEGINYIDGYAFNIDVGPIQRVNINGGTPVTSNNIGNQNVKYSTTSGSTSYASSAGHADSADLAINASYSTKAGDSNYAYQLVSVNGAMGARISASYNLIPVYSGMNVGSSQNPWSGGYGVSGWITTSDENLKTDIKPISDDARWLAFVKEVIPYTFQMLQGTSGRYHIGFIAQQVEKAMAECGISDMEFAGLVKAPVYAEKLKDEEGNELNEYDITSEIIDYTYHLRYEEFIPLLFLWLGSIDSEA